MQIPILDRLLEQYNALSERTQTELITMLNAVSGKHRPENDQIDRISGSLKQLYEMYEQIYDSVKNILPEEEILSKEASISELLETMVSGKMQLLERARDILSRFTSVESVSEIYSQALLPFQQDAALMLEKAKNTDSLLIDEVDVISEASRAPELFLKALDSDDFDSDEALDLSEQVRMHYSPRVQMGLVRNMYFYAVSSDETPDTKIENTSVSQNTSDTLTYTDDVCEPEPEMQTAAEENTNIPEEAGDTSESVTSDPVNEECVSEEKVISDTVDAGNGAEAVAVDASEDVPEIAFTIDGVPEYMQSLCERISNTHTLTFSESPRAEKAFGVKNFKSDLKGNAGELCVALMNHIFVNGYISAERIAVISEDLKMKESAESLCDYLYAKGYLKKYTVDEEKILYFLSRKGIKAYTSKDSASFLKMKMEKNLVEIKLESVNAAIMHLLHSQGMGYADKKCKSDKSTTFFCKRTKNSFVYGKTSKGETPCICTALFGYEVSEIADYFLNLSEYIQETGTAYVGVLGYDFAHAEQIKRVLEDTGLCSVSSIYSFVDDCWRDCDGVNAEPENSPESETKLSDMEETDNVSADEDTEETGDAETSVNTENTLSMDALQTMMSEEDAVEEERFIGFIAELLPEVTNTPDSEIPDEAGDAEVSAQIAEPVLNEQLPEMTDESESGIPEEAVIAENTVQTENPVIDETEYGVLPKEADKSEEEITDICLNMICADKLYCASAYLKSMSLWKSEILPMYKQLAYAINDPMEENCSYTSDALISIFYSSLDEPGMMSHYCLVAALIRNYFMDHIRYDYSMQSLRDIANNNPIISSNSTINQIIYKLYKFKEEVKSGLDRYADYRAKENADREAELNGIILEAKEYYTNYIEGNITEGGSHKRFIHTQRLVFAKDGELGECLKITVDNDTMNLDLVKAFLQEYFIKDDAPVDPVNIDTGKLDIYINRHWDEAGKSVAVMRKSSDLMGSFRGNLFQRIQKSIRVMARWVKLMETANIADTDEGYTRYKALKETLLDDIDAAMETINSELDDQNNRKKAETAGRKVLLYTLEEIRHRLDGSYTEAEYKFFYIDFLKNKYVLLNQDYLPNITDNVNELVDFLSTERIYAHYLEDELSVTERLREIFEKDDDFGTAQLLLDYAKVSGIDLSELGEITDLKDAIQIAAKRAENAKNNFVENLELQQSYGQIENTLEDKKDKILASVNKWFIKCSETNNFGYFVRILKAFEEKIKKEAKVREETIRKELENYCNQHPELLNNTGDAEDETYSIYRKRLEKIHEMIEQQNYTVAEDMIHRLSSDEEELELELLQNDYLQQFINEYDRNAKAVMNVGKTLVSNLRFKAHNKDARGAARLADNWLSNGGTMGKNKLISLLKEMGFDIAEVAEESKKDSKHETYSVRLNKVNGNAYAHPIAAFGSSAAETCFRVVCLYGKFDSDGLLNVCNEMDTTKHTLVLLDYVLPQAERRRLARKIKESYPLKIFAVIDRVVLMYLIHNYADAASMLRKLMAVIIPYSCYQPYVVKSADVMPPEMFIGRKEELRRIEDPKGVNIVYGGRQLGKSALLRMAKNDVNFNKENHRAILVDIKEKDEKGAARKISQALSDEGVFSTEVETDDWDELTRVIKKRLISESEPKIPYLLLLLDEADTFIESSAKTGYHAFDALKDIQSIGEGRFKFVVAGLRNIIRFNRDKALTNNRGLIQLESITVKPFNVMEAKELLEIPLFYLGLRFPKKKDALVSMILASSNYFPGLIQLYCSKLLDAMCRHDYAGYNENDTPPYIVSEKHIKKVISDAGFQQDIRDKFFITLKVADDDYYYIIALLVAYLYYESDKNDYTPKDVWDIAEVFDLEKITALSLEQLTALMEEMKELNVLRITMSGGYLFTRYSFFQMMGTKATIEDEICKYMEG